MRAWNDWYHCTGNTYGTWLPGSELGWREYQHRQHVDGDYRSPPPDTAHRRNRLAMAKRDLKRDPVYLSSEAQRVVCESFRKVLDGKGVEVVSIAIDTHHFHLLARFPDHNPRHLIGIAKRTASTVLKRLGLAVPGGVWARRSLCKPIVDRAHQVNTAKYIVAHAAKGATVWRLDAQ
jgi:REP element-mobilizing transposase RayT